MAKNTKTKNWQTNASAETTVTGVSINWTNKDKKSSLKALGTVTINNCIAINISIIESKTGDLFVSLPSTKKDDKYYNLVFISDTDVLEDINNAVLDEFNN